MKTLIVEDNVCCRSIVQKMLASYGLCSMAGNGEEAVNAFKTALEEGSPYELILMDIMMPVLNGYQALERIRVLENEKGIPEDDEVKVIMTTSCDDSDSVVKSYDAGATSYLEKPIDREALIKEIKSLGLIA